MLIARNVNDRVETHDDIERMILKLKIAHVHHFELSRWDARTSQVHHLGRDIDPRDLVAMILEIFRHGQAAPAPQVENPTATRHEFAMPI